MRAVVPLLFVLVLLAPARADECVPTGPSHEAEVGGFYVDNDLCQPECLASAWIYQESNGIDGLQRRDHVYDDTCAGMIEPDTRVALLYAAPPQA